MTVTSGWTTMSTVRNPARPPAGALTITFVRGFGWDGAPELSRKRGGGRR